jgi:hypothetical protein
MAKPSAPVVLDLTALPASAELSRPVSEALALAASVVLDHLHGMRERHAAAIHGRGARRAGEVVRVPVDDVGRATYADRQEATEEGGEGVALLVARHVLDRIVFRRLPKSTGADYLMRDPRLPEDSDAYERLECSGIGDGRESAAARLERKIAQLARFPQQPWGQAVVTDFGAEPIEIRFGGLPQ